MYIARRRTGTLDGTDRAPLAARRSGVNRGQREHRGSFRGYPKQRGGAVFS